MRLNPKNVRGQGLLWMLFVVPVTLTGSEDLGRIGVAITLLGVACLVFLNVRYATTLNRKSRGIMRAEGDKTVARWAAGYLTTALILHATAAAGWWPSVLWTVEDTLTIILIALLMWGAQAIMLSTLFDWYWMRAWRDGVVVDPPCVRAAESRHLQWKNVTRWWIVHRFVAALSVFVALIAAGSVAWVWAQDRFDDQTWVMYLLTIVAPLPIVARLMPGYLKPMAFAPSVMFSNVRPVLGDVLTLRLGDLEEEAMLHELSLDQGLVLRTPQGRRIQRPFEEMRTLEPSVSVPLALSCSGGLCRSLDGLSQEEQPCDWGTHRLGPVLHSASASRARARSVKRKTTTPHRWFVV